LYCVSVPTAKLPACVHHAAQSLIVEVIYALAEARS